MLDHADSDTVGDSAYRQLRNDIIFGRLKPAEKLRLEPLRVRYGVSVTTLREILNRLTSDGFVFAEGQKGFQVLPVSASDLRELADLRILIEGHALRQSFAMGDLDWEAQVVAAYHKLHVLETRVMGGAEALREECDRHGIVLVFDEIVTGFRFTYEGAQNYYGVVPDVCTLGKIIGGGFALAAIAGLAVDMQRQASKRAADEVDSRPHRRDAKSVVNRDVNASLRKPAAPAHNLQEIFRRNRRTGVFEIAGLRLAEAVKQGHQGQSTRMVSSKHTSFSGKRKGRVIPR